MSYCRWSSDHFECDAYVYEDVSGGWTTHIAGRRRKTKTPDEIKAMYPEWGVPDWADRYMAAREVEKAWFESQPGTHEPCNYYSVEKGHYQGTFFVLADSEYIDLSEIGPEAGETYNDPSPGECADRLERLKAKGFNVPQHAIDALREEQQALPDSDSR